MNAALLGAALAAEAQTPSLRDLVETNEGLLLRGTDLVAEEPRVDRTAPWLLRFVVDLPGAVMDAPVLAEEPEGPVLLRYRAVRYRTTTGEGIRLRVDLSPSASPALESDPQGLLLRLVPVPAQPERDALSPADRRRLASVGPPGSAYLSGTAGWNGSKESGYSRTLTADLSVAQTIPNLFVAEGRLVWGQRGGASDYVRATGVARGFDLGRGRSLSAGFGDLFARFSLVGGPASGLGESLDLRGEALRLSGLFGGVFEAFEGRTRGAPAFVAAGTGAVIVSEFTGERALGLVSAIPLPPKGLHLGFGWVHTSSSGGASRDNRFLELGWRLNRNLEAAARIGDVSGEETPGEGAPSGYLWGFSGRFATDRLDLSGAYRRRSTGYFAPGGSQEFPGEKGSNLQASYRPADPFTFSASLYESTAYPLATFDQGPVQGQTWGAAATYQPAALAFSLRYLGSAQRSISDSPNPVDARSDGVGADVSLRVGVDSVTAGVILDRTRNRTNDELDMESLALTASWFGDLGRLVSGNASLRLGQSKRSVTGEKLQDWGVNASLNRPFGTASVSVAAYYGLSPAGSAAFSSERWGGTVSTSFILPFEMRLIAAGSYAVSRLEGGTPLENLGITLSLNRLLGWGKGYVQGSSGTWDSGEAVTPVSADGVVEGRIFVDSNGDGVLDEGEPPVAGVVVECGPAGALTDVHGRYRLRLEPGRFSLRMRVSTLPFALVPKEPEPFEVDIRPRSRATHDFAVTGFGSVRGRIVLKESRPGSEGQQAVAAISVSVAGPGVSQRRVSDEEGRFQFGGLPPGEYRVTAEPRDLPDGFVFSSESEKVIRLVAGSVLDVTFEIRALTVRERFERRRLPQMN